MPVWTSGSTSTSAPTWLAITTTDGLIWTSDSTSTSAPTWLTITTTDGRIYCMPRDSFYPAPLAPSIERPPVAAPNIVRSRERPPDRLAAEARARALLLENLTPVQRDTFERNNSFVVEGGASRQRYRIGGRHLVANIEVLDRENRVTHRLCGHLRDMHPLGDHLLAQKIMLELDEERFLRLANRHVA